MTLTSLSLHPQPGKSTGVLGAVIFPWKERKHSILGDGVLKRLLYFLSFWLEVCFAEFTRLEQGEIELEVIHTDLHTANLCCVKH